MGGRFSGSAAEGVTQVIPTLDDSTPRNQRYPKLIRRQPADDNKWFACFGRGVQHPVLEFVEWFIWCAHKAQIARAGVQHIGQATTNHDQCWLGPAARRQAA